MKRGSKGPEVADLQHDLNWLCRTFGAMLDEDGKFGQITASKVMDFQREEGIKVDGIVGPQTRLTITMAAKRRAREGAVPPPTKPTGAGVPPGTAPKKAKPTSDLTPMTKEEARKFIRDHLSDGASLTDQQVENVVRGIWKWGNRGLIPIRVAAAVGAINTTAGIGMALPPLAAIAGVITSLISWSRALESSECTYGYRGICYAMTWEVWSVRVNSVTGRLYQEGFAPKSSPEMKSRILQYQFESEFKGTPIAEQGFFHKMNYQDCWNKGVSQAAAAIDKRKPVGVSPLQWRLAIQFMGKEKTPQEFCKGLMTSTLPQIKQLYPRQADPWRNSIRSGPVYPA